MHFSRFGAIQKNHNADIWRLIVDLSHPDGASVNDGIGKELCSLKYIKAYDVADAVLTMGQGAVLAKIDIKKCLQGRAGLPCRSPAPWHGMGRQAIY